MSKPASETTKLRNALSDLRRARNELSTLSSERDRLYRKAVKAEQEVVEWKNRFDVLLHQSSTVKIGSPDGI